MTGVEAHSGTPWIACPDCLTLSAGTAPVCSHCGLDLGWIDEDQELQSALAAGWTPQLRLRAEWQGAASDLRGGLGETLELPDAGGGPPWQFVLRGPPYCLAACRDGAAFDVPLPGSEAKSGLALSARAVAVEEGRPAPEGISDYLAKAIAVDVGRSVILGRRTSTKSDQYSHTLPDPAVEMQHAMIACQRGAGGSRDKTVFWIVDLGTRIGTFVDRQSVIAKRLVGGNIIQIGGFAWIFNESDGLLVPVRGIQGAELRLQGVAVDDRLQPADLLVPPGQFVAVAGQSGAGKSTLIRTILGEPNSRSAGTVAVAGFDCDADRERYRAQLGYVPQRDVAHADLQARQAVEFNAELRNSSGLTKELSDPVTGSLRRLDIPQKGWARTPGRLSGGEAKRVRIASELIADPKLLLLDEPASGLDQGREIELLRLLRGLSLQGCTVIVITHGLHHLELFDRVLLLHRGRIAFDGAPEQLRKFIPSGSFLDLDLSDPPALARSDHLQPTRLDGHAAEHSGAAAGRLLADSWRQLRILLRREFTMILNRDLLRIRGKSRTPADEDGWRVRWWILPLLIVPLFFATALHVAVRPGDQHLLPFFAVLSAVWMGSSLSLLSIVNERETFDHERLLFLRLGSYTLAKTLSLWLISASQTVVFVVLLEILRRGGGRAALPNPAAAAFSLVLVGWAAAGLGLAISACSGTKSAVANFLLPLVMIVQIVFTAEVAGYGGDLDSAYGGFHLVACQGLPGCARRVSHRFPKHGEWLCDRCRGEAAGCRSGEAGGEDRLRPRLSADERQCLKERLPPDSPAAVAKHNRDLPSRWAVAASCLTISRYGDIAMRSLQPSTEKTERNYGYTDWRREAVFRLLLMLIGFPAAAMAVLWLQTSRISRELASRWSALVRGMVSPAADSSEPPSPPPRNSRLRHEPRHNAQLD